MPRPEPKKRRERGSGTVFQDKRRGVWIGRVKIQGKYHQVSHEKQATCLELMKGIRPASPATTVAEWSSRWLESIARHAPLYRDNCRRSVQFRINPVLGHIPLRKLTAFDVEQAAQTWGTKCGTGTVLLTIQHLGSLCQSAVRAEVIDRNPVSAAHRPRAVPKAIDPFTADELARIIAVASSHPKCRPIAVMAGTGCRMGELLALDAGDYHASTGILRICKGDRMMYGIGPTKTANSVRSIRVPVAAQEAASAAKLGRVKGPLWMVDGKRMTRHMVNHEWRWVLKVCGYHYRNPHQCRHTVASQMLAGGASPADVAAYLGATVAVIVRTYLHPSRADTSRVMDRLLSGARVANESLKPHKPTGNLGESA